MWGQYCGDVSLSLITQQRPNIGTASPEIYALKSIRYAIIQEPQKGDSINEGIVKQLTGNDPITGRQLYGNLITFKPMFNLVVCTNNEFKVKSNDDGIWRRMKLVNFPSVFKDIIDVSNPLEFKKKHLDLEKMAIPLLTFLIDIVGKTKGKVTECKMITNATNAYRVKEDKIGSFIKECIMVNENSIQKLSKREISECSVAWFETNYRYRISNMLIFEELDKLYECCGEFYYGIKINYGLGQKMITRDEIFINEFNNNFTITNNSKDYLKATRFLEWAKENSMKVSSSKSINNILLLNYQLDTKDKNKYKLIKINGIATRCWAGIIENKK